MKKLIRLSFILAFSMTLDASFAHNNGGKMDKCQVSGGQGSLMVESLDKSKITITIKSSEGTLILSEEVSSESGKLQLLGLSTGSYVVEVRDKKESKTFVVEVL